jgi:hypothetical protein
MKLLVKVTIVLVLSKSSNLFAQNNIAVTDNIQELYRTAAMQDILVIKDSLRGGTFIKYNGPDLPDDGMIFKDAAGKKWLRQTTGNEINLQWYGARSARSMKDTAGSIYPLLLKAMSYLYTHPGFTTITLPKDNSGIKEYFCHKTIYVTRPVKIKGDGYNTVPQTAIFFPVNTKGFVSELYTPENTRNVMELSDLSLHQYPVPTAQTGYDSSAHMIESRGFVHLSRLAITYTGGDGVHLNACSEKNSPKYGNTDGSVIEDVEFAFCNNGIYLNGCDANIIKMSRNFYTNMRRWGLYNNGFLGSQEKDAHYSVNGNNSDCIVKYNAKFYVAINTDYFINTGKQPDKEPAFWEEIAESEIKTEWDPKKKYWSGGPYFASNENGYSKFDYNYTEANQPPARVNNKSIVIGGDNGAGVKGGPFLEAAGGLLLLRNAGLQIKNGGLAIGDDYLNAKLQVTQQTTGEPGIWIKSAAASSAIWMTNNKSKGVGGVFLNGDDLELCTITSPRVIVNSNGIVPYSNNQDLGSNTKIWNNGYVNNFPLRTGFNQPAPAASLHVNADNASKAGIIVTGGGYPYANLHSGQIKLGDANDYGSIGYDGVSGINYYTNMYNSNNADHRFITKANGTPVNAFTIKGSGQLGVMTNTPDASAQMEISSSSKGFLPPRMTTKEKNAITSPAEGLMVYDLTLHKLCIFTGKKWETITSL